MMSLRDMLVELSSFWMYDASLVREQLKGAGQTVGRRQLAKPAPLAGERVVVEGRRGQWQQQGEGGGGRKERAAVAGRRVGAMGRVEVVHGEARACGTARRQCGQGEHAAGVHDGGGLWLGGVLAVLWGHVYTVCM